ncbi:hypothetical protein KY284_013600 [Solanum tuberosum]|nr:hypothetical protein KY284_013600 [Solanum tuberosum]
MQLTLEQEKFYGKILKDGQNQIHDMTSATFLVVLFMWTDLQSWEQGKPGGTGSRMGNSNIGMSSVGISIGELLTHHSTSAENIRSFQSK